jgi:hypothetical protein
VTLKSYANVYKKRRVFLLSYSRCTSWTFEGCVCVRVHVWYVRERAVRHAARACRVARVVPGARPPFHSPGRRARADARPRPGGPRARRYNIVSNKYMHMWYTISKQKPAGVFTTHSRDTPMHTRASIGTQRSTELVSDEWLASLGASPSFTSAGRCP